MARCEDLTWWQKEVRQAKEDPPSRFDRLPAEVIELILFLLPSEDVLAMASSFKRVNKIVDQNATLALHKKPAEDLVREAANKEEVWKCIRGS